MTFELEFVVVDRLENVILFDWSVGFDYKASARSEWLQLRTDWTNVDNEKKSKLDKHSLTDIRRCKHTPTRTYRETDRHSHSITLRNSISLKVHLRAPPYLAVSRL